MEARTAALSFEYAQHTAESIRKQLPATLCDPQVAIICGSGLGGLADTIHEAPRFEKSYAEIVNLISRFTSSEPPPNQASVTNAAGGLNPHYNVGDIVVLNDHLNLAGLVGVHPLHGPNADDFGARFPPMSDAYDLELRRMAHHAWHALGLDKGKRRIHEGVYSFVGGPSYETRAECRMLRLLGADVVGMSTVPEIIVARHSGMRILAFSLVTNNAVLEAGPRGDDPEIRGMDKSQLEEYLGKGRANHEEVLEAGREAAKDMQALVRHIVSNFPDEE
ncbi:MAG: hypothetical protein Q9165_004660 [Trypethelium subeluteriae]